MEEWHFHRRFLGEVKLTIFAGKISCQFFFYIHSWVTPNQTSFKMDGNGDFQPFPNELKIWFHHENFQQTVINGRIYQLPGCN